MAFLANNIIITGNNAGNLHSSNGKVELPAPKQELKPETISVPDHPVSVPIVEKIEPTKVESMSFDRDHHILIINGKEKKISKHSSYLLDMLTLD